MRSSNRFLLLFLDSTRNNLILAQHREKTHQTLPTTLHKKSPSYSRHFSNPPPPPRPSRPSLKSTEPQTKTHPKKTHHPQNVNKQPPHIRANPRTPSRNQVVSPFRPTYFNKRGPRQRASAYIFSARETQPKKKKTHHRKTGRKNEPPPRKKPRLMTPKTHGF